MSNGLMNNMLTEVVMEKAIRDKIQSQQREQQKAEKMQQKKDQSDDEDDFDLDEDDLKLFAKMKEERLKDIMSQNNIQQKKESKMFQQGEYREITEDEFLTYTTKNTNVVVHFYHNEFIRCKIIDKHLHQIARDHPECIFVSLNVEKVNPIINQAPFFVQKLQIKVIPTLCLFIKGIMVGQQIGFEGFSGDEFKTIELVRRLVKGKLIKPKNKQESGYQLNKVQKIQEDSDDSDY